MGISNSPAYNNLHIKETESLIALLCYLDTVEAEPAERLDLIAQICAELERRGTIKSAQTLIEYIK
jgi:hypothetical protein